MRVLDAAGKELRVGDRVERVFPTQKAGGMVGEVDELTPSGTVWVVWNQYTRLRSAWDAKPPRFTLRPIYRSAYRCPDLKLIDHGDDR